MQDGRKNEAIAEYDILGEMQLNQGQRNQAIQTIQAILKMKPDNPDGYRQLLAQIQKGTI
jgi:predicted Zn-dependent protease